jgi:hypothetical protein
MFPFLWVPELSPASATSFSQQQLTTTEHQRLSNYLTNSPTNSQLLICPAYNISARTAQKTPFPIIAVFFCCCETVAFVSVGGAVTQKRLLYSCLFHGSCLATGLRAIISYHRYFGLPFLHLLSCFRFVAPKSIFPIFPWTSRILLPATFTFIGLQAATIIMKILPHLFSC